ESGKSLVGNIILGRSAFVVGKRTARSVRAEGEVHGRHLTVVDTPGWYCHSLLEKTSVIDKLEIRRSVSLCPPGPHVILLTVPIAIAFNKPYQIAVEKQMGLLGKKVWNHTIVLFTRGDWLGDTTIEEQYIACEGEALQELVRKCGNRYYVLVNTWANRSQVQNLIRMIELMMARNRGEYFTLKKKEEKMPTKTLTEEEWNKREDELIERIQTNKSLTNLKFLYFQ
uniref:AIG1-type G domain-containing protein n=1 Tax=Sinocyclocheilus grahami TaxID=75366 RepID=A0A672MS30_SINGR